MDFSKIEQIRADICSAQTPAAERAIQRFALERDVIKMDGVECDSIKSGKTRKSNGKLLYLFGGGFISGSPYCDLPIIGALAEYCQVEIIAPKYRLAPEHPFPAAADDCFAVWQEIASSNQAPLLLAGESAGGNLALGLVQRAHSNNIRIPDAMALMSPAADLRTDPKLFEPTLNSDPTMQPERIFEVASAYAPNQNLTESLLSPLFGSFENFPPTIITTGSRDMLMAMCLRLYRRMKRNRIDVECRVWDGLWHVFEYFDAYPEAMESLEEIAIFLKQKGKLE